MFRSKSPWTLLISWADRLVDVLLKRSFQQMVENMLLSPFHFFISRCDSLHFSWSCSIYLNFRYDFIFFDRTFQVQQYRLSSHLFHLIPSVDNPKIVYKSFDVFIRTQTALLSIIVPLFVNQSVPEIPWNVEGKSFWIRNRWLPISSFPITLANIWGRPRDSQLGLLRHESDFRILNYGKIRQHPKSPSPL